MNGRRVFLTIVGFILGGLAGGCAGLLGGLLYTSLAATSGFEGHAGYVVVFWLLGGIILGMIAGLVLGIRISRTAKD